MEFPPVAALCPVVVTLWSLANVGETPTLLDDGAASGQPDPQQFGHLFGIRLGGGGFHDLAS